MEKFHSKVWDEGSKGGRKGGRKGVVHATSGKSAFFWDNNHQSSEVALDTVNLLVSSKVIFCPRHSPFLLLRRERGQRPVKCQECLWGSPSQAAGQLLCFGEVQRKGRPGLLGGRGTSGLQIGAADRGSGDRGRHNPTRDCPSATEGHRTRSSQILQEEELKEREEGKKVQRKEKRKKPLPYGVKALNWESPALLWDPARGEGLRYLRFA